MKYCHHPRAAMLYTVDDFHEKQVKLNGENLTVCVSVFVRCVDGVQGVCARMVTILHTETFLTFDVDPSLFQDQLLPPDLGLIK